MAISRKRRPTGRRLGDCTHARLLPSGQCRDCGSLPGCGHQLREAGDALLFRYGWSRFWAEPASEVYAALDATIWRTVALIVDVHQLVLERGW